MVVGRKLCFYVVAALYVFCLCNCTNDGITHIQLVLFASACCPLTLSTGLFDLFSIPFIFNKTRRVSFCMMEIRVRHMRYHEQCFQLKWMKGRHTARPGPFVR